MAQLSSVPLKTPSEPRAVLKAGTYPARVVGVYNLGRQKKYFQGKETGVGEMVRITFELVGTGKKGETPVLMGKSYYMSLDPRSKWPPFLRSALPGITDEEIKVLDVDNVLLKPVILTVEVREWEGRQFNSITTITSPMEDYVVKEASTPVVTFLLHNHTAEEFEALPAYLKDKVMESLDYSTSASAPPFTTGSTLTGNTKKATSGDF